MAMPRVTLWQSTALLLAVLSAGAPRPAAHEIPLDIAVHAFLKPEGHQLRVLVRVPLRAMRDIEFPTRGPGFLDLARAEPSVRTAALQWIGDTLTAYEEGAPLQDFTLRATRVSLPSDRSFESWDTALATITGPPLPAGTDLFWDQGMLDALLEYPIRSDRSSFSLRPAFSRLGLRVTTVLRFVPPDGTIRAFEFSGDPGVVRLDPRWHQAARTFVELGFFHILDGPDHLLFLLCLVLPCRKLRPLVLVVTSFTVAHSITLIGSAFSLAPDALWFPPLVETLIATSIVYMALENVLLALPGAESRGAELAARREQGRYLITFAFGLVHGFGFSFALRETMQFAGSHLLMSLLSFNLGVEVGQILVLLALVPALRLLFRYVVTERVGTIIVSAFVAHTGWHWTLDRWGQLRQFGWPTLDSPVLLTAVRWLIVIVGAGAAVWVAGWLRQVRQPEPSSMEEATPPQP